MSRKWIFLLLPLLLQAYAAAAESLSHLLARTQPLLQQELQKQSAFLPTDFLVLSTQLPPEVSARRSGAVAEYDANAKRLFIFKHPLKQWLKAHRREDAGQQPALLARCLTPVYVHELSHARDQQQALKQGFFWPITLEDEYAASFWQLSLLQAYRKAQPDYDSVCEAFLPPAAYRNLPPCQAQDAVYHTYAQAAQDALPVPFTTAWITSFAKQGKLTFAGHTFSPGKRTLTARQLFTRGGNWMQLAPKELQTILQHPLYLRWQPLQQARQQEYTKRCK